jgi:acid stress chaperone HdeB
MRGLVVGLLVGAVIVSAAPARAQVVDLSTITCKDFFEGPNERISYVLFWLDAYYRDEDDPAVIDFNTVKANAAKLGEYCARNPTIGLITAADTLFDK